MDYVEEAKRRKENMVPFLSRVLSEEKNYQLEGEAFGGVVHAAYLLGIFGDVRGFKGLLSASRLAGDYEVDWVWEALPECYLRLGKKVIPLLMEHIEIEKKPRELTSSAERCMHYGTFGKLPLKKGKRSRLSCSKS